MSPSLLPTTVALSTPKLSSGPLLHRLRLLAHVGRRRHHVQRRTQRGLHTLGQCPVSAASCAPFVDRSVVSGQSAPASCPLCACWATGPVPCCPLHAQHTEGIHACRLQ